MKKQDISNIIEILFGVLTMAATERICHLIL